MLGNRNAKKKQMMATGAYGLQSELGGPVNGSTEKRNTVRDPVKDGEPVADLANKVVGDFPAEVPEEAGKAVDADFSQSTEQSDDDEEEGQLGAAQEVL